MMREALESLVSAIENGRTDIVLSIVSACEKCEIEDEGGITMENLLNTSCTVVGTVLHLATKLDDADSVRTLLSAGANPEIRNTEGQTALDLASSPKVCDVFNQELLQCIAQSNTERVCQLLAANVSVNLIDSPDTANTPLHWAACYANKETVQCLINRNASVNAVNNDGATPLHDAMARGEVGVVEALLEAGAVTSIKCRGGKFEGKTPIDLGEDKPELQQVLEKYTDAPEINGHREEDTGSKTGEEDGSEKALLIENNVDANHVEHHTSDSTHSSPRISKGGSDLIEPVPVAKEVVIDENDKEKESLDESELSDRLKLLWPRPQHIIPRQGPRFILPGKLTVFLSSPSGQDLFHTSLNAWLQRQSSFRDISIDLEVEPQVRGQPEMTSPHVVCEINPRLFQNQQAYRITINETKAKMQASCVRGLNYAINTFLQLVTLSGKEGIQQIQIHDWPCIRDRAVLLDFSKGRIPKLDSMANLIDILAALNYNQVQIYTRFRVTKDTESDWQLPYSKCSVLQLDTLCQSHQMELVPVLDVAPSVDYFDLVSMRNSFLNFVQCFPSAQVVGIGPRLTSLVADSADEGVLHMDEMDALLPVTGHQVAQLCAFVFHDSPSLLKLPPNTMLTEYGFEATYDFNRYCKTYAENGVTFAVMAGTSAWNSLAGCPEAALANISSAVECAVAQRALSVIIAHWASSCHMTHQPISWPGFLVTAGLSWNSSVQKEFLHTNLAELLNEHVFKDRANVTGQVIVELGRAETYILRSSLKLQGNDFNNMPPEKGSVLYQLLSHPDQVNLEYLSPEIFQKTMRHVRKCVSELSRADLCCKEGNNILNDLKLTGDLVLSACRVGRALGHAGRNPNLGSQAGYAVVNLGVANLLPTAKTDLANRLLPQIETFKNVWLERSLPNSLQEALGTFAVMLKQFIPQGHTSEVNDSGI